MMKIMRIWSRIPPVASAPMVCFVACMIVELLTPACVSPVSRTFAASMRTPEIVDNGANTSLHGDPPDSSSPFTRADNGLARGRVRFNAPPMGWSSWNRFGGEVNQNLVKAIADAMTTTGMKDAGYTST